MSPERAARRATTPDGAADRSEQHGDRTPPRWVVVRRLRYRLVNLDFAEIDDPAAGERCEVVGYLDRADRWTMDRAEAVEWIDRRDAEALAERLRGVVERAT